MANHADIISDGGVEPCRVVERSYEDEIERLRRVEEQHNNLRTAAANLIVYLDLGGDHREMLSKLKAALEEK